MSGLGITGEYNILVLEEKPPRCCIHIFPWGTHLFSVTLLSNEDWSLSHSIESFMSHSEQEWAGISNCFTKGLEDKYFLMRNFTGGSSYFKRTQLNMCKVWILTSIFKKKKKVNSSREGRLNDNRGEELLVWLLEGNIEAKASC